MNKLCKCCADFGMQIPQWPDRVETVQMVADVEPAFKKMKREAEAVGKECELIIAILPQKSTQYYCKFLFSLVFSNPTIFLFFSGNQTRRRGAFGRHHSSRAHEKRHGRRAERKDANGAEPRLEDQHENGRNQLEGARRGSVSVFYYLFSSFL